MSKSVCTEKSRFMAKISPNQSGCWLWIGHRDKNGYGKLKVWRDGKFKSCRAHRVSWELFRGAIVSPLLVCHTCDNPPCVNPFHLFLGTNDENMKDKVHKGRLISSPGSRNGSSKLNESAAKKVRSSVGVSIKALAAQYKVSEATISRIQNRKTWRHI